MTHPTDTMDPNGRAIPRIVTAVLLIATPTSLQAQQTDPPPADDLDWRDSLTDSPSRTEPTATTPSSPARTDATDRRSETLAPPTTGTDLGGMLLEMVLVLAGVCALAYAVLRWGVRGLVGAGRDPDSPLDVLARCRIGSDRSILVVRVGSRALVLGDSDAGLTRLDTLEGDEFDDFLTQLDSDDDNETTTSPLSSLWQLGAAYPETDNEE